MWYKIFIALLFPLLSISCTIDQPKQGNLNGDIGMLQGKWKITDIKSSNLSTIELIGKVYNFKKNDLQLLKYGFAGEYIAREGKIKLYTNTEPKGIDIIFNDVTFPCIYEIKEDTLKIRYPTIDYKRPKTFDFDANTDQSIYILERLD